MEKLLFWLYNIFVVPVFCAGFRIGSYLNDKMKEGRRGRYQLQKKMKTAMRKVDTKRPRIHFHATSVGEWEQAVPIIDKLKVQNPDLFISISFFSPSGYKFAKNYPNIDLKVYLPLDRYKPAKQFFSILKPQLWIISKFDVWPNHVIAAHRLNIPVAITAATLSADSKRNKGVSKFFNRYIYKKIDYLFPISADDKSRFLELFPYPDKISITGDTRFDRVHQRGEKAKNAGNVKLFADESGIKIIGGSIWPADEKHFLPALINIMHRYNEVKAVLVPHELHEAHISDIESTLSNGGIDSERYTDCSDRGTEKRLIIVNTIGVLARLYMQTDIAYIGGSFSTGVHNVMEPAVFEQPVLFGPRYLNSFEACELIKEGSAFSLKNRDEMEKTLELFVSQPEKREQAGEKAKALIERNLGATDKIINILNKRYDFISKKNTN